MRKQWLGCMAVLDANRGVTLKQDRCQKTPTVHANAARAQAITKCKMEVNRKGRFL